ncbi:MAG: bifunctional metallophosphatase/5'-nucleotidase [Chitinophagaceae bacterium]|nr:bifunctional metallophosphatase/5'-nucleotidase [Chitinophagaceae bacterium]
MCTKHSETCNHQQDATTATVEQAKQTYKAAHEGRRKFLRSASLLTGSALVPPAIANAVPGDDYHEREIKRNKAVQNGKATHFTLLHTSDIHAQLRTHDEFFWENGKAVFKKRGGMAVLKTMLHSLKSENPANTILIDGGDCFQGGGVAALTEGRGIIPLMNNIGYDLLLPGNWEVVYGKENMRKDLGGYNGQKICANMFHDTTDKYKGDLIFPPYWTTMLAGVKIGFIGYNDPLTPKRQSPAYSFGIKFTKPEMDVAKYIDILRNYEKCAMVFLVTHMGLAQQVDLANKPEVQGVDYILGADTHERVRKPIQGTYAKVTEPGAFGSFVAKLDVVVENGIIKDENYQLLDVDPERYKPDTEMEQLIEKVSAPYKKVLDLPIGKSKTTLTRYYVIETNMDNLVTDALAWKFPEIDIVVSNGFRFCPPLVPDPKTGEAIITNDYLWSMLPVDSEAKKGEVTGEQLWDWLEKELRNVFSKDPAKRFGGWVIRFKGMEVVFTMNNSFGNRVQSVNIKGQPLDKNKTYTILACEREGDPEDTICRIDHVKNPAMVNATLHDIMREYLAKHSPVSPKIEGRIKATDAPSTLLSQLEGYDYEFI